jgi:hypothetical protein
LQLDGESRCVKATAASLPTNFYQHCGMASKLLATGRLSLGSFIYPSFQKLLFKLGQGPRHDGNRSAQLDQSAV